MQEPQEQMDESEQRLHAIKRHRWTAMWNGVVIGMGAFMTLAAFTGGVLPLGVIPLILGVGLEVLHRRRLDKQRAPPA